MKHSHYTPVLIFIVNSMLFNFSLVSPLQMWQWDSQAEPSAAGAWEVQRDTTKKIDWLQLTVLGRDLIWTGSNWREVWTGFNSRADLWILRMYTAVGRVHSESSHVQDHIPLAFSLLLWLFTAEGNSLAFGFNVRYVIGWKINVNLK